MRVDGPPGAQVPHWYAAFYKPHATFGYDLLLEPIPDSTKIRCTISSMTDPAGGFGIRDTSSSMVPLPDPLTPLVIESGDKVLVSFLPEPTSEKPFVQYLKITLKPPRKRPHPSQAISPYKRGLRKLDRMQIAATFVYASEKPTCRY